MSRLPFLTLIALSAACTGSLTGTGPGGDDDDDGTDARPGTPGTPDAALPPQDFSAALAPLSAELTLGETRDFTVTLSSENGFAGDATLVAAGIPASWQVTFDPSATVTVPADGVVDVTMRVLVPTDAEAGLGMLTVSADTSIGTRQTPAADITVTPTLIVRIPANALDNPSESFGGSKTVRLVTPGTTITWVNDDALNHRIHADGINGFDHEGDEMVPGGSYSVVIQGPGQYDYSCHIHGQMTGQIIVLDN